MDLGTKAVRIKKTEVTQGGMSELRQICEYDKVKKGLQLVFIDLKHALEVANRVEVIFWEFC